MTADQSSIEPYQPAPRDEPWCYPGRVPEGSFGYDGGVQVFDGPRSLELVRRWLTQRGSTGLDERIPVLCSGSNANPAQIAKKSAAVSGDITVPFLLTDVAGIDSVYAALVADYGSIPATFDLAVGITRRFHLALYTREQLAAVTPTELPEYALAELVVPMVLPGGQHLARAYGFISAHGVLSFDGENTIPLALVSQRQLLGRLFSRLSGTLAVPSLDEYLRQPRRYTEQLFQALGRAGLTRASHLDHRAVESTEARNFAELLECQ